MITGFMDQLKRLKNTIYSYEEKQDKISYKLARKKVLRIK